jgi:TPR repeat protein
MLAAGGEGVERDPGEAARLLRLAAEGGEAEARLELAGLLLDGPGRQRDGAEAVRLLRAAAAEPGGPGGAEAIARLRLIGAWEVGETAGKGTGAAGVRSRWW